MLMLASETGDFGLHNSGPREIQEKQALKLEVSCDENNDNDNNTSGRGEWCFCLIRGGWFWLDWKVDEFKRGKWNDEWVDGKRRCDRELKQRGWARRESPHNDVNRD